MFVVLKVETLLRWRLAQAEELAPPAPHTSDLIEPNDRNPARHGLHFPVKITKVVVKGRARPALKKLELSEPHQINHPVNPSCSAFGGRGRRMASGMQTFYRCRLRAKKGCVRLIALGWITIGLLLSTGCSSISTTHTQDICEARFTPSDPVQVEILPNVPARPHIELGQVWAYSSNPSGDNPKLEAALRKEAAKLGADAFVVWHDGFRTEDPASPAQGGRLFKKVPGRTVIGAAIKYQ